MKKGSLVGIILAEQCFIYCTCTISMKNILETLFLLQITLGLEFGMTLLEKKKKKEVDDLNLSITLIKAIPILSQFKNS